MVHDSQMMPCDGQPWPVPPPVPQLQAKRPSAANALRRTPEGMVLFDPGHTSSLMPTVFFILAAAAFCDLRLAAEMVGLRVQAKLINDGPQPVELTVGDKCTGPAFRLTIDGE